MQRTSRTVRPVEPGAVTVILVALAVLATLLPAVSTPAPAEAAAADPVRERGLVTHVADGDTIDVLVDGDSEPTRIRLSGIQAFEIGECGYEIATDRLTELILDERVLLRAADRDSSSLGRPIRSVHLDVEGYGEVDIIELLLLEGMGLWFPIEPEITDTADYNVAATHAIREQRGIWQDHLCGRGPQFGHPIDMWVRSDADGNDARNLNDEYVRIVNRHETDAFDLTGWLIRESSQFPQDIPEVEGYLFPDGTAIPPGEMLTVRVGSGTDSADELFMGSDSPLFDNSYRSIDIDGQDRPIEDLGMGDGVYLLDPLGNVRESYTWPCVVDCETDLRGKLVIHHVEYDPPGVDTADNEYVELQNVSDGRIHLDGYQLRNIFVFHEFLFGTYLDPGEILTVTVGTGTDTRLDQYWGQDGPILRNAGDRVAVVSYDERFVDCVDWGEGRDCPWPVTVPGEGTTGALPTHPRLVPGEVFIAGPFGDVRHDATHAASVDWLAGSGITAGCGDGDFCPGVDVTREQMATFLKRGLELAPGDGSRFDDVARGATHAGGIGALADEEITSGCGDNDFCPRAPVTREQMATFLTNALELEPTIDRGFDDVDPDGRHAGAIGALAEAGITSGCGGNDFCPRAPVTRQQMATFLRNALE